jgi:hypothetical protein
VTALAFLVTASALAAAHAWVAVAEPHPARRHQQAARARFCRWSCNCVGGSGGGAATYGRRRRHHCYTYLRRGKMSAPHLHLRVAAAAQDGGRDVDADHTSRPTRTGGSKERKEAEAAAPSSSPRSPKRKLGEMSLSDGLASSGEKKGLSSPPSAAHVGPVAVTDDDADASCLSDTDVEMSALASRSRATADIESESTLRPPLRFAFKGWSVWLDVEEPVDSRGGGGPFAQALAYAARRHSVRPIPAPHVTVIYGIDHIDDEAVRQRFSSLGDSLPQLRVGRDADAALWPPLTSKGVLSDIEIDGVNGGTMTMAWSEVSLQTSEVQELLVQHVWDVMMCGGDGTDEMRDDGKECPAARSAPWVPHLSLCYDNPEETPLNLIGALDVVATHPFLLGEDDKRHGQEERGSSHKQLRLTGLSLWNTEGTIDEWCCVDRIAFPR